MAFFQSLKNLGAAKKRKKPSPPGQDKPGENINPTQPYTREELISLKVDHNLNRNLNHINNLLGHNADYVQRKFVLGHDQTLEAAIIFLDSMIDPALLGGEIMKPLLEPRLKDSSGSEMLKLLTNGGLISRAQMETFNHFQGVVSNVLTGEVALFVEGFAHCFIISSKGYKSRSIPEPHYENAVRGPREAFVENISINISLLRKRLVTPNLVFENITLGKISSTNISIVYIKGLASEGLIEEVRERLRRIETDAILESGYLESFIVDNPRSPFPQLGNTERPDRVAGDLLEGRVAILTDTTPLVLIAPGELMSFLQTSEDYYTKYQWSTFVRWLRFFSLFLALTLPSLYIAITTFHQEMLPTTLFVSVAAARKGVPFPAVVEALIMEVLFETIREAAIRLPANISNTISIVGALVLGQAAVQANIVSPLMIIIVAATGVASFTIPQYSLSTAVRLIRFPLMLLSAVLGLFGLMVGLLAVLLHLCSLRSFGVPYLSPIAPFNWDGIKDTLLRSAHWSKVNRPQELVQRNRQRMKENLQPGTPDKLG
ncbi:GerA spore germination protein [Desulforamulus reducens MI-1]|uniref:GerA spore germination protein n=1 Tax=Desulforamulus reducens (strain ATCC BAA-1160 / DSM 100696 / MI-1) TaxID=349161 RepID=A4J0K1_DESRM|nr:spore germination protein [Desulforamulus reducens]ABO48604.1 GerA spore germination protein [Desulforamulus reducens MI-1]